MPEPEPLALVEIVVDEIGVPRGDGTAGSALYLVPLRLNRQPTNHEASWLMATWDRPPTFSTMHRPGIMRVTGDQLVLNGTTVEEVEKYHVKTLKAVLAEVNRRAATFKAEQDRAAEEEARRKANVAERAARIDLT